MIIGFEYTNDDQAKIDEAFDALFNNVVGFGQAKADNSAFRPTGAVTGNDIYTCLTTRTPVSVAQRVTVTENTPTEKSLEVIAGFEMVGVVTYPLVSEISFVLLDDRMIVAEATRVNFEDGVPAEVRRTGAAFRDQVTALNQ